MKKQAIGMLLCAALSTSLLSGCGGGGQPAETSGDTAGAAPYSISANAPEGTVTAYICQKFDESLRQSTGDAMTGNVYLNGTLGNDTEVAEQVMSGQVQFLCTNTANLVTMMPELAVMDMPGVLTNLEQARGAMDNTDFRGKLNEIFENNGMKLLLLSDQGFRQTSSNKALRSLADFKGLDIRTMENNIHMNYWQALGANPTPMNRAEVFISLQQGLLEAQEDPYCSIQANNYAEVQKYIVETNHIFSNIIFVCNLDYYNSLPEDDRAALDKVCDELLEDSRSYCDKANDDALTAMQDEGMEYIKLDESVLDEISKIAAEKVTPLVREQAGEEMTDLFMKAANA